MARIGCFRSAITRLGFQRHHLIPIAVLANPCFSKPFENLLSTGFDPDDFSTNGIYLPSTEKSALYCKRPLHRGPHPVYNELVAQRLSIIFRCRPRNSAELTRQNSHVRSLQDALARRLSSDSRSIMLNRRDPLARDINFKCLDDDLEKLWLATGNAHFLQKVATN